MRRDLLWSFLVGAAIALLWRPSKPLLLRAWRWATYWPVKCEDCNGTGICVGENSRHPHSCCGACDRRAVPTTSVPPNGKFACVANGVLIGNGRMWVRPWAPRRQVERPR